MRVLIWFRRDLRTYNHPALEAALALGFEVEACFVFDRRWEGLQPEGFPRMGARPRRFVEQCVDELELGLSDLSLRLHRLWGNPVDEVGRLALELDIQEVWFCEAWAYEEREDEKALSRTLKLKSFEDFSLYRTLPFGLERLPKVFTEFRKQLERNRFDVEPFEISEERVPEQALVDREYANSALPFRGGQYQALARLKHWIPEHLKSYKETRNQMLGTEYSSKMSAFLAWGCVSPVVMWSQIKSFERVFGSNESTYWLGFELLWREFFLWTWRKSPRNFYAYRQAERHELNSEKFERWRTGNTGNRFVDGHMRELLLSGYMSNRGRQNVASYLIWDLELRWVSGARWFESALIDYEPCNNYGNWTYLAGVGNDPRGWRRFDPERQQSMYDPGGAHARFWL